MRQLEAFRAVMETGSVTRAATTLHVSQPAVSKLLAALARECGFDLFRRRSNRLFPTSEAMALFGEVERVFVGVEKVSRFAGDIRDMRFGQLSIASFPAITTRFLPKIIVRFRETYPGTAVSLVSRSSRALVDWIAAQRADIGIGLMTVEVADIEFQPLGSFDGVCVLPPGHPLTAKDVVHVHDLDGVPFIEIGADDRSRARVDRAFEGVRIHRNNIIEAQQSEAACAFVAAGAGVSVVEPFSASGFRDDEIVVRPFRPRVTFDLWLMLPTLRPRAQMTDVFVSTLRESLASFSASFPPGRG
ncbi:LysR substrate-binding domain-containing protein [Rhodoligotrophos appendicifer]|uniref:LysR substrate-binding domain-containing protein n=1 Tax=Rhodoligotrophos appendicifer TaxID=987056 RepID=UPI001FE495B5|nr:LysR substrate-binding domain-containing protein [Rhodoligotrophos appendicifer]